MLNLRNVHARKELTSDLTMQGKGRCSRCYLTIVAFFLSHITCYREIREKETLEGPHTLSSLRYSVNNIHLYWKKAKTTYAEGSRPDYSSFSWTILGQAIMASANLII